MHYISKFNKKYDCRKGYEAFIVNFAKMEEFIKKRNSKEGSLYWAGYKKLSDWSDMEYEAILGLKNLNNEE